jgi:hypothetical protein
MIEPVNCHVVSFVTFIRKRTDRTKRRDRCAQRGARVIVDHAAVKVADRVFSQLTSQDTVVDWRQVRAVRGRHGPGGSAGTLRQLPLNSSCLFTCAPSRCCSGVHGAVVGVQQATRILAREAHGGPR